MLLPCHRNIDHVTSPSLSYPLPYFSHPSDVFTGFPAPRVMHPPQPGFLVPVATAPRALWLCKERRGLASYPDVKSSTSWPYCRAELLFWLSRSQVITTFPPMPGPLIIFMTLSDWYVRMRHPSPSISHLSSPVEFLMKNYPHSSPLTRPILCHWTCVKSGLL